MYCVDELLSNQLHYCDPVAMILIEKPIVDLCHVSLCHGKSAFQMEKFPSQKPKKAKYRLKHNLISSLQIDFLNSSFIVAGKTNASFSQLQGKSHNKFVEALSTKFTLSKLVLNESNP